MTLSVWQAIPQMLFTSWACAILSLTVAVSFFERCHKRGIMDSQCVFFATGCPRRCRKPGIEGRIRVQQYSDTRIERGYYTACADPWLSHCSFSPRSSFSSRHHGRTRLRLLRRDWRVGCFPVGVMGAEAPGVRGVVSSSADVTAVVRATNIDMKLRETSTPKTRRLRPSAELQFGLTCKGRTLS